MTERALVAEVYALIEATGECERCQEPATNEVDIGVIEDGKRRMRTCLPCALDLVVMLMRKGRLHRD